MALHGADAQAIIRNAEALLVDAADDCLDQGNVQGSSSFGGSGYQRFNIRPAFVVQLQADGLRFMPEHIAKKFASLVELRGIHPA